MTPRFIECFFALCQFIKMAFNAYALPVSLFALMIFLVGIDVYVFMALPGCRAITSTEYTTGAVVRITNGVSMGVDFFFEGRTRSLDLPCILPDNTPCANYTLGEQVCVYSMYTHHEMAFRLAPWLTADPACVAWRTVEAIAQLLLLICVLGTSIPQILKTWPRTERAMAPV